MQSGHILRNSLVKSIFPNHTYKHFQKTRVIMNTKLTLTLDETVIQKAKAYAKANNRSLSNLIESYLKALTQEEVEPTANDLPTIVKSLKGSVPVEDPQSFDEKKVLEEALLKKYLS